MDSKELKEKVLAKVAELEADDNYLFGYFGVRTQEEPFALGEIKHLSHQWTDSCTETDEILDGICTVMPEWYKPGTYYGDHVAIIAGNNVDYGQDPGELIITEDATVVAIIC